VDLFRAMEISAGGLNAQRVVVQVISTNLANVHTTRTEEGGPYRRRQALFSASPISLSFSDLLSNRMDRESLGVKVDVIESSRGLKTVYDPSHPDADETGYVILPNINAIEEMVGLLSALRNYEANVTAFNAAKNMLLKALEIGR